MIDDDQGRPCHRPGVPSFVLCRLGEEAAWPHFLHDLTAKSDGEARFPLST